MTEQKMPNPWFRASTHNFSIYSLVRITPGALREAPLSEGERQLGWLVLPPFQRPPVWSLAQKVRFIESIWNHLPIGVWVYNRTDDMNSRFDNWLLDGQQRVTAILEYVDGQFPVYGYRYNELSEAEQRHFRNRPFAGMEAKLETEAEAREVYDRLAYGGTPHEPK